MQVALVGITGYAGMVLYQLLRQHPAVDEIHLYDHKLIRNEKLSEIVPTFYSDDTAVQPYDPDDIMADNQLVFFATSAGVTSKLSQPYIKADFPVIDLSGDLRLNDEAQYQRWYHKPSAPAQALNQAHYGLADFHSAHGQKYVANPGCYATATLLGLAPLVKLDLIDPDSIIVDAKSGTSGAGKKPVQSTHFTQANDNLQIYKPNQHQHIPEIMLELQRWNGDVKAIEFMTTLIPITRGIMSTIYAKVKPGVDAAKIDEAYHQIYDDKLFVHYSGEHLPDIKQVVGTNNCHIGVVYNPTTHTVMADSVIDNLLKGAAGQAVQNFNQMFNYQESSGLELQTFLP